MPPRTFFAVFVRVDLGAIFAFVIVLDAERAAVFGQRRLSEQAGVFEHGEVGEIAPTGCRTRQQNDSIRREMWSARLARPARTGL
jgi:hypothetical protein